MKFVRKSLFWVITLVFLGGTFYLLDQKAEENKKVETIHRQLFSFEQEGVQAFWIETGERKERIRVVRVDEGWQVSEPLQAKGDDDEIQKFLINILKGRRDAVLFEAPSPEKLQELGLDAPEVSMGFETGETTAVIRFGNRAPTNNVAYAMFDGDPRVYRIHSDIKEEANKSVYALRDKTILAFDPLKMVQMELLRQGKPKVVIYQQNGRWDMAKPVQVRASMNHVLETLYAIKDAEIKAFVEEHPVDLTAYDLEPPVMALVVVERDKKEKIFQLLIGAKDRSRRGYFAKRSGTGPADSRPVFLLEEKTVHALMADHTHWQEVQE